MIKIHRLPFVAALLCAASLTAIHAQNPAPAASPQEGGKAECTNCGGGHAHAGGHRGKWGADGAAAGGGQRLERLISELNLSAEQQAQIKPLIEAAHTQAEAVRADSSLSREQKMAKLRETHQALRGQLQGILTAEQKQKLETLRENFREHHGRGQGDGAA